MILLIWSLITWILQVIRLQLKFNDFKSSSNLLQLNIIDYKLKLLTWSLQLIHVKMSTPSWCYGVLHGAIIWCHMEYSMGQIFEAIWSASKWTPVVSFYCPMECSMSQKFDAIWSTPWVKFLRSYGVLQNELQWSHSIALWSVP